MSTHSNQLRAGSVYVEFFALVPKTLAADAHAAVTDSNRMLAALRALSPSLFESVTIVPLMCAPDEYVALLPGPGSVEYEQCTPTTVCSSDEYEAVAATRITDRICKPISECILGATFEVSKEDIGLRKGKSRE